MKKSGVVGVYWHSVRKKWQAQGWHGGKQYHLGYFEDLDEAAAKRREFDLEHRAAKGR